MAATAPVERDRLIPGAPASPSASYGRGRDEENGRRVGDLQIDDGPSSSSAGAGGSSSSSSPVVEFVLSLLRPIPSICLMAFLNLMMAVPFGSTILSPVIPLGEAARQQVGMRMSLLALSVGQFSMGSLPCGLSSAIESVTPWQMGELSPFYWTLAEIASKESNGDPTETISTTLYLLSLSTLSVAATFYILGKTGLASVTYFFPTYVMLGLVGGVGIWMVTLSATISISPSLVEGDKWWDSVPTVPFLLSVIFSLGLFLLRKVLPKDRFPLLDPVYFLSVPVVFYAGLWLLGISYDEAVNSGYMFKDPSIGADGEGPPSNMDPWDLWEYFDFSKVHFSAVVPAAPTLIASSILCVVLVAPFIPPLATFKGMDDFDMNHEFKAQGYANFISGILSPGGLAVCLCYSTSAVYSRAGGKGKLPSAALAFVIFLTFIYGPLIVNFLPRCLAGALILDMGIILFLEGIMDPESKCDHMEYVSIWIIIAVMTVFSMTASLVAGLGTALVTHTLQSYTGQEPVRIARDASTLRSSRWRNPAALALLADPIRGRKNIAIFMLQGHLFFGNMNILQKQIFEYLQKRKDGDGGTSMVILDFSLVVGIDSSAMVFIDKLKTQMQKKFEVSTTVFVRATSLKPDGSKNQAVSKNVLLPSELLTDEDGSLRFNPKPKQIQRVSLAGSFYTPQPSVVIHSSFFDSLDQALSSCEDALIAQFKPGLERERTDIQSGLNLSFYGSGDDKQMERDAVMEILGQHCQEQNEEYLGAIFSVLTRECFEKDHVLWNLGDGTNSAKILVRGSVFAFVDEHDPTTFRESIKRGAFMGLRGLVLHEKHLATVRCETETVMYSLDEGGYQRLLLESPNAARLLDLSVARYLSHRLQHVSNRIYESKSLPL